MSKLGFRSAPIPVVPAISPSRLVRLPPFGAAGPSEHQPGDDAPLFSHYKNLERANGCAWRAGLDPTNARQLVIAGIARLAAG